MTNARFEDLERRVIAIKRKKYTKVFFLLVVVFIALFFVFTKTDKVMQTALHVEVKPIVKEIVKKEKNNNIIKQDKLEVTKKIETIKDKNSYNTIELSPNINIDIEKKNVVANKIEKKVFQQDNTKKSVKNKPIKSKKVMLYVKEVKNEEALLERFRAAGDFDSSIALSKLYFQEKKYDKSIYWSKKASKLLASDAQAWIIYAKSKNAIGKKDEAIKALELYLEYFSSNDAQRLLSNYRSKK